MGRPFWQGKAKVSWEKPVTLPLCPLQISHGLTKDRTRASRLSLYRAVYTLVWIIEANELMAYMDMMAMCSKIHTKQINALFG